jgi:signal transduction histidine kinase
MTQPAGSHLTDPSHPGAGDSALCRISGALRPGYCVFQDVMQTVAVGITVFQGEGEAVLFQNPQAEHLLGPARSPEAAAALWGILAQGTPGSAAMGDEPVFAPMTLHLNGRLVGASIYGAGPFNWVFTKDVTEKSRLEALAEDREYISSIGGIFSSVRHELGNPLNSMKMTLSVLGRMLPELDKDGVREYLDRLLAEMGRMEGLLASLKSFSMFESVVNEPLDLGAFFGRECLLVKPQCEARGAVLDLRLTHGLPPVLANRRALQQVLLNLVMNSLEALAGTQDPTIRITAHTRQTFVAIRIMDNGPGIPPEYHTHLFKPFFTTKKDGTGLGLVIAKKLMMKMNGTIAVDPDGRGAAWLLTLPVAPHA